MAIWKRLKLFKTWANQLDFLCAILYLLRMFLRPKKSFNHKVFSLYQESFFVFQYPVFGHFLETFTSMCWAIWLEFYAVIETIDVSTFLSSDISNGFTISSIYLKIKRGKKYVFPKKYHLRAVTCTFWTVGWIPKTIISAPLFHAWNYFERFCRQTYLISVFIYLYDEVCVWLTSHVTFRRKWEKKEDEFIWYMIIQC